VWTILSYRLSSILYLIKEIIIMLVVIKPGEKLLIAFSSSDKEIDIDGEFTVEMDTKEFPHQLIIRESAGLRGFPYGKANGILYQERFDDEAIEVSEEIPDFEKLRDKIETLPADIQSNLLALLASVVNLKIDAKIRDAKLDKYKAFIEDLSESDVSETLQKRAKDTL
jgi:hypothetical protein